VRFAFLVFALSLVSASRAAADGLIELPRGTGYSIDWVAGGTQRHIARPRGDGRKTSLDRWLQVAPGGRSVAVWSAETGLDVLSSTGANLWHRKGDVTAFRFSPTGDRLAFASAKGVEVVALDRPEPRSLARLAGVEWLRWIDAGLLARARGKLLLIDEAGKARTLTKLAPAAVVAASRGRVVTFDRGVLVDVDITAGGTRASTKLPDRERIINAALSPDGTRVLLATAHRVYLIDGTAAPEKVDDVFDAHSLFFSVDGSAYLWAGRSRGGVVSRGKRTALPSDPELSSALFRQDGGADLALTTKDGTSTWNPTNGARVPIGGISSHEGRSYAGDAVGGGGVVLYYTATSHEREMIRKLEYMQEEAQQ